MCYCYQLLFNFQRYFFFSSILLFESLACVYERVSGLVRYIIFLVISHLYLDIYDEV